MSGISTGIKMLTSFFMAKLIAVKLGPEGLGLIGQLNSFVLIVMTLSTGAITNGVVKYIAQYQGDKEKQSKVIHASITITLLCTLLMSVIVAGGASFWSSYIFNGNQAFYSVFLVFGLLLIFYSSFNLFVSILNGFQLYKQYSALNITTSIIGLLFSIFLIYTNGLLGALYATVSYQSVVFLVILFFSKKYVTIYRNQLFTFSDKAIYKGLMSFSLMSIVSTLCVPYVQILIRKYLVSSCGAIEMGLYEGISRISLIYLTIITTTLSVYYLPRLSEIKDRHELKKEIGQGYKIIMPLLISFCLLIFLFRKVIINLVFSESFAGIDAFFLPQLIGDVFKIASWLLAFIMLAKAMTKTFIVTEVIFSITLYVLSVIFVNYYGAIGAVYAYALNYVLYLVTMLALFRKTVFDQ